MNFGGEPVADESLAVLELERDLLFHRIPAGRVRDYAAVSLDAGREQAARFAGRTLSELCAEKRIEVHISEGAQGMAGMTFRAKIAYRDGGAEFTIFRSAVDSLVEAVNPLLPPEDRFTPETALDLLVAHEYYHFLEFSEIGDTADRAEKVEIRKLFGKRRFARIMRCGEVGAYAFAKAFLGMRFLPNLVDYLYLIATGKWTRETLEAQLAEANRLLAAAPGER